LKAAIEEQLKSLKDQVILDIVDGGVRIQIVDLEGRPMFPSGSAEPNEKCRQIIKVVSENIKDFSGRIAVEGHTDASPFKKSGETNWELSTARASSARKELEHDGIDPDKIARVVGYADTEPLIKENPADLRNRRISIILLAGRPKAASQAAGATPATGASGQPEALPPIISPPTVPNTSQPVVAEPSGAQKSQQQDSRSVPSDKDRKRVIDTGIKPDKPIDVRPSIFPGLDR